MARLVLPPAITGELIANVHAVVFSDRKWKSTDVFLAAGGRPVVTKVADLMLRLEAEYAGRITNLDVLREWYIDFQTIHAFPDGNRRTAGVIVAAYSHQMHPLKGWLGPKQ